MFLQDCLSRMCSCSPFSLFVFSFRNNKTAVPYGFIIKQRLGDGLGLAVPREREVEGYGHHYHHCHHDSHDGPAYSIANAPTYRVNHCFPPLCFILSASVIGLPPLSSLPSPTSGQGDIRRLASLPTLAASVREVGNQDAPRPLGTRTAAPRERLSVGEQ